MLHAFILLLLCSPLIAEKETARTARAFRNFPQNLLGQNIYPAYHIPNIHGPGTYAFGYEVEDPATRNLQFRDEEKLRDGTVRGAYGVLLPNGEVFITKYLADGLGYRTHIERHNLNEVLQNYNPLNPLVGQVRPLNDGLLPPIRPYSIQIPGLSNNQLNIQTDTSTNSGVNGWFGNLGANLQNALRPPSIVNQPPGQGPLASIFRPLTNLFNRSPIPPAETPIPSSPGLIGSFLQNIPLFGGRPPVPQENTNYNNVEQFAPIQSESLPANPPPPPPTRPPVDNYDYDYDIPIIRPLAVNTQNQHVFSNLIRAPEMIPIINHDEIPVLVPIMPQLPVKEDGWFKRLVKRRRLQQHMTKEAKKEIKDANKKIRKTAAANAEILTN